MLRVLAASAWLLAILASSGSALVQFNLDAPDNTNSILFKSGGAVVKFRKDPGLIAMNDPRLHDSAGNLNGNDSVLALRYQPLGGGAVVEIEGSPAVLNPGKWIFKSGASYVYDDILQQIGGLRRIAWKSQSLSLTFKTANYVAPPPVDWLEVRLAVGQRSYCGRFVPGSDSRSRNESGYIKVRGSTTCAPLPTPTPTSTPTVTHTPISQPTGTFTPTPTFTPPQPGTPTESATPADTATRTATATRTITPTRTVTPTPTQAPDIFITSPIHGIFTQSSFFAVTGQVTNPDSVPFGHLALTINGQPVTLQPNLTFSYAVTSDFESVFTPVLAELRSTVDATFVARDRIVVVAGASVPEPPPGFDPNVPAPFPNNQPWYSPASVALRLNESAFAALAPVISNLFDIDPSDLIEPGTSVGSFIGIDVTVDGIDFDDFGLGVDTKVGKIDTKISIYGLDIDLAVGACDGRVTADVMDIYSSYALDPRSTDPERVKVTQIGQATAGVTNFNLDLSGLLFLCDIAEFFGNLFVNIEQEMVNGIQDLLNNEAPIANLLQDSLDDISITGPIAAGIGATIKAPMFDIPEDEVGLTLAADIAIVALAPDPNSPNISESYDVFEPFPSFTRCVGGSNNGAACMNNGHCPGGSCQALSPGGLTNHIGMCLSTSAFNQMLRAVTELGVMTQTLTEIPADPAPIQITAGFFSLLIPQFATFDPNTPLKIRIVPTIAPIVTGNSGPKACVGGNAPGFICVTDADCTQTCSGGTCVGDQTSCVNHAGCTNGTCVASLAELRLSHMGIEIVEGSGPGAIVHLAGVADFSAGVDLAPGAGGLGLSLGNPSGINIILVDNQIGADEMTITALLPVLVSEFLPQLAGTLGGFPLPDLFGATPAVVEVSRNDEFMCIYMNLVVTP